ncbi:MAG: transglycosylase domain-containing protein [Actinomycetota bacterium]
MSVATRQRRKTVKRRARPRSRLQRWLLRFGWILPVAAILIGGSILTLTYVFASIPLPRDIELKSAAEVFDRHGNALGEYSGEERRFLLSTEERNALVSSYVGEAVVAAEDRDFYDHGGVSIRGIVRAAWANLTGGEISQGGSTITQQYIKNAVLHDTSRTVTRKIKEAVLAIKLERQFSKREILGFYLDTIYLGRGAYGIEAAARTYFAKHASELTLAEAAYLAGIIPAPESYQPDENQPGARERRDDVLNAMVSEGFITGTEASRAMRGRVKAVQRVPGLVKHQRAAYFMEWIRKDILEPEFGKCLYTCGLKIYTTLDPEMQTEAENAVDSVLTEPGDPQAALVSVTPTGEVRAFVGGRDYTNVRRARGFNFASDNKRHAGSAFKPFTLAAAIEEGISPNSRFSGRSPAYVDECAGENGVPPWVVDNYGGSQYGTITLDQATTNSVNAVYAQLIAEVGPEKVAELLEDFGFKPEGDNEEITPNCSLALGTLDVSPVQMARAYAGFAARGALPEITPVRYVTDSDGNCLKEFVPLKRECEDESDPDAAEVIDQNTADVLTQTLTHVVEAGTATIANIERPVAGKTGTAQDNKDAWFGGYVPQLATVVWMGYPCQGKTCSDADPNNDLVPVMGYCADPELCRPVHGVEVTGGSSVGPAAIWAAYMREATEEMEVLPFPVPTDLPDRVINSPAPTPSAKPSPKKSKGEPTPTTEPSQPASPSPSPPPTTDPSPKPTILPSPTTDGRPEEDDP